MLSTRQFRQVIVSCDQTPELTAMASLQDAQNYATQHIHILYEKVAQIYTRNLLPSIALLLNFEMNENSDYLFDINRNAFDLLNGRS